MTIKTKPNALPIVTSNSMAVLLPPAASAIRQQALDEFPHACLQPFPHVRSPHGLMPISA
jgi:hypothetical protein